MIFVLSFFVMLFIIAAMAIGVIAGREPIKGSCGGLAAVGIDGKCEICGDDPKRCEKSESAEAAESSGRAAEFYDASK